MNQPTESGVNEAAPPADAADSQAAVIDVTGWIPDWAAPWWDSMQEQPWLLALVLIAGGMVVAKLIQVIFSQVLGRLTRATETDLDDRLIALLTRPIFTTVFMLTLIFVVAALKVPDGPAAIAVRVLETLIVLSWMRAGLAAIRLVLEALGHIKHRFELIEERTIPLFDIVLKVVIVGAAAYILLAIWGIDPTAWLASAGIIGIAVGFAAKDTLANLFSGVFIVADAPYKIGDYIVLDTGERGEVTRVGMRSTRLLTRDDIEITVPNAVIGNAKIINESGGPWEKERIRLKVGVAYGSDLDQVVSELEQIALAHEHIVKEPAPRVRLREFGSWAVRFELLCWIDHPQYRGLYSHELYMAIYQRFDAIGIEIPYQKHDVYIKSMPPGDSPAALSGDNQDST